MLYSACTSMDIMAGSAMLMTSGNIGLVPMGFSFAFSKKFTPFVKMISTFLFYTVFASDAIESKEKSMILSPNHLQSGGTAL